jgi:peptidoglycan/LPS O-acetylase OafA/YrhL
VFACVVYVFASGLGPISRFMKVRPTVWLGEISYSIYMWHTFLAINLIDRPIDWIEKLTGKTLTVVIFQNSQPQRLIALGEGALAPALVTLFYMVAVLAVAAASHALIERPGQNLFAALVNRVRREARTDRVFEIPRFASFASRSVARAKRPSTIDMGVPSAASQAVAAGEDVPASSVDCKFSGKG